MAEVKLPATKSGPRALRLDRDGVMLVAAAMVGVVMGLAALAFIGPIQWLESRLEGGAHSLGSLGVIVVLTAPMIGAFLTAMVFIALPIVARGHGVTWVLYAVSRERSRLPLRLGVRQWLGSTFTIGSGGSAGPEGPIVTIGSTIGSVLARRLGASPPQITTLLGCGAAAGLAAVFNAPLAGIFFVLEVILRDFSLRTFTPIVIASVMGTATAQTVLDSRQPIFGIGPGFFEGAPPSFTVAQVPSFALLGGACALVAIAFARVLRRSEHLFARVPGPAFLRPLWGACALGLLGAGYVLLTRTTEGGPPFFGNGYALIRDLLTPAWYSRDDRVGGSLIMLAIILGAWTLLKMIATACTLGSGGAGGLFAPSLLIGATVGGAFGAFVDGTGIIPGAHPASFALVGMGCTVAASSHAPLTGVLLVYELTQSPRIILPLMLAAVVAVLVARWFDRDSIYTAELRRLGVQFGPSPDAALLRQLSVSDLRLEPASLVHPQDDGRRLLELAEQHHADEMVMIDDEGCYLGMITAGDLRAAIVFREALPLVHADEMARRDISPLAPDLSLDQALDRFSRHDVQSLPVVDPQTKQVLGMAGRARMMRRYQDELERQA
ncbi:MAG: chloride channel protein [Phycisphaeraceae bacterium]|nr:chloride channel protein [Phycisphaeraceae bacterium]